MDKFNSEVSVTTDRMRIYKSGNRKFKWKARKITFSAVGINWSSIRDNLTK